MSACPFCEIERARIYQENRVGLAILDGYPLDSANEQSAGRRAICYDSSTPLLEGGPHVILQELRQ
jgi:hypothetical protein